MTRKAVEGVVNWMLVVSVTIMFMLVVGLPTVVMMGTFRFNGMAGRLVGDRVVMNLVRVLGFRVRTLRLVFV